MTKLLPYFLVVIAPISGCLDTIEIPLPQVDQGRLVISGQVQRSPDVYRIIVSVARTTSLEKYILNPEDEADIELIYQGRPILSLLNNTPLTLPLNLFYDQYGGDDENANFNIEVTLPDGSVFTSKNQYIPALPEERSLSVQYEERKVLTEIGSVVDRGFVILNISSDLSDRNGNGLSFLYSIAGLYRFPEGGPPDKIKDVCYVPDSWPKNEVITLKSTEALGDRIIDFKLTETRADGRFSAGYYFTVVAESISEDAASYWEELGKSIKRDGTIYDPPVGALRSNIRQIGGDSTGVLGYFYTAGIDTVRYLAKWEETGRQSFPCEIDPFKDGCENCLTLGGSSLEKPHYWKN